jgi:outer membrane protein TolC
VDSEVFSVKSQEIQGYWIMALVLLCMPAAAFCQTGSSSPISGSRNTGGVTAQTGSTQTQQTLSSPAPISAYSGSVPAGTASTEVLRLSLEDAINRGLKQNLGILLASDATRSARGEKWKELSNLLPNITTGTSENLRQVDLRAEGIAFPGVPAIIGPFGYFDTRAYLSQSVIDFKSLEKVRSASESQRASAYSAKDARELVVLVVGLNYLQAITAFARIQTAQAQIETARTLFEQAGDQQKAGTAPQIDTLRANVEFQTRQQQLIAAKSDFAKQKLALARAIGLPLGQEFVLTDDAPYRPASGLTLDEALRRAFASRSDYQSALAQVHAAEYSRKAASAGYLPSVTVNADYGDIGVTLGHSHGTVDITGTLQIPIFQGGKVHGEVLQAEATLAQNRQQLENLRAQIDQDVRDAMFDLQSATEQVEVSRNNVDLANQALTQAKDRFLAGVTNNLEVVQAQEAVATASESYITSVYNYNAARISLGRAIGFAEQGVRQYLKGN